MENCRICNHECDGILAIDEFRYNGGNFIVCRDCFYDYERHDMESISKKIEGNPQYVQEKHQRVAE